MDVVGMALLTQIPAGTTGTESIATKTPITPATKNAHVQVTLTDGTVLVVNGNNTNAVYQYDPVGNVWTARANAPVTNNNMAGSTLLDGRVLITGGGSTASSACYIYTPSSNTWSGQMASPTYPVIYHKQVTLQDGKVLVMGGWDQYNSPWLNVQMYDPVANTWSAKASMPAGSGGTDFGASLLSDGTVFVSGGYNTGSSPVTSTASYNPTTNTWTSKAALPGSLIDHGQSTSLTGTVIVTGGYYNNAAASSVIREYNPASNSWSVRSTALPATRMNHTQSTLLTGAIFGVGGQIGGTNGNSTFSYDPGGFIPTKGWGALLAHLATA